MLSQNEIRSNLYKSLTELGLTEHELNLYTISLTLGPTTVAKLAESLAIPRPNVYKVIEGLVRQGLARGAPAKKYKKLFVVESPSIISDLLRKKRDLFTSLDREVIGAMPDLLAMYKQGAQSSSIRMLEGEEQFIEAFDQIIEQARESEFFGSAEDFVGFISWAKEQAWIQRRLKNGVRIKCLLFPGPVATTLQKDDANQLREIRILKGIRPFATSFQLFANKVIIWQPKAPLAILISDEYIVQMLRNIFYSFWEKT